MKIKKFCFIESILSKKIYVNNLERENILERIKVTIKDNFFFPKKKNFFKNSIIKRSICFLHQFIGLKRKF